MTEVLVTVQYEQDRRVDLALPYEVPSGVLAEALAHALGLLRQPGQVAVLAAGQGPGKDTVKLLPTQSLADAAVLYGDLLVLSAAHPAAQTTLVVLPEAYLELGPGRIFTLSAQVSRIGRWAPGNQVDLDLTGADPQRLVSRQHARIEFRRQFFIIDQKSQNGTWLNGQRIPAETRQPLQTGDALQFGGSHGPRLVFFIRETRKGA